jgi:hypothetical protein
MAAVTAQLIESLSISLKTSSTLEHSRTTREIIDTMQVDVANSQVIDLYAAFDDRSSKKTDSEMGNYLVLHRLTPTGVIVRTVGYYLVPASGGNGWIVYRHDSDDGTTTPGVLPAASTSGTHEVVLRAVNLPSSNYVFRNVRNRAVALRGEFGSAHESSNSRTEFINFILATKS